MTILSLFRRKSPLRTAPDGARKGGARPAAPRPVGDDAQHVYVDDLTGTILADITRRDSLSLQQFLAAHTRATGRIFPVSWVPFSEVTHQATDARQRAAQSETDGETGNARGRAIALLKTAARARASDVHILRRRGHTEIQLRIKKNLVVLNELNNAEGDALLVAMYRLGSSQDNTFKENETQDGGIAGEILDGTGLENVRIVRGPAYPSVEGGGHMELRLQYREKSDGSAVLPEGVILRPPSAPTGRLKLRDYGFDEDQVDRLLYIASAPSGMLLFTGPTGSGKTTSIFEMGKWQARSAPGKRAVAIEQPVEYPMPWAVQLEISNALSAEAAGERFRENLRYSLRMDPDRLIIGEIRDAEVALTSFDASQTGHSVLSTLHIEDPFDFPLRFQNMDFNRLSFRVTCNSSVIRGIVAQRLLPVLCEHCKQRWTTDDERMPKRAAAALCSWGDTVSVFRLNPTGCVRCQYTGVGTVTAVAEVVETDEELMNDIVTKGVPVARRRYRSRPDADTPMVERAVKLALQGTVDPASIIREVALIPFKEQVDLDRARGRSEREHAAREAAALDENAA